MTCSSRLGGYARTASRHGGAGKPRYTRPSPWSGRADDNSGGFWSRAALPAGWRVLHEPSVESTNDLAREAARRNWPDRSVFVADYQTRGRGRHGRTWLCPPRPGC